MKKWLFLLAFLGIAEMGNAQVLISILLGDKLNSGKIEFGLDGGINFNQLQNIEGNQSTSDLHLGFYFDFLLKNQWYLNTGVLVLSTTGQDKIQADDFDLLNPGGTFIDSGRYIQEIEYFHVPVLIKYRFKNHFYVKLGPQVALRTSAYLYQEQEEGKKLTVERLDNRDLFNRLELSGVAGFGYTLQQGTGMNIGVKYYQGFTNILKDSDVSVRNSGTYIYVNIPIGRGKAEKKKLEEENKELKEELEENR